VQRPQISPVDLLARIPRSAFLRNQIHSFCKGAGTYITQFSFFKCQSLRRPQLFSENSTIYNEIQSLQQHLGSSFVSKPTKLYGFHAVILALFNHTPDNRKTTIDLAKKCLTILSAERDLQH
jgi:hypothetical protein